MPKFDKDNILSTRFTNKKNDTIEVIFLQGENQYPYYVPVDPENLAFQDLQKAGWDIEKIQQETVDFNRAQSKSFNLIIDSHVEVYKKELRKDFQRELNKRLAEAQDIEITKSQIFKAVIDNNKDDEIIFKAKLAIFDIPKIKNLKDRAGKMKLRKAKTLIQTFAIFEELMENVNDISDNSGSVQ